jgi:hypothetical protein
MKGTVALSVLHFLEKELSPEQRAPVLAGLPEPWGERFAAGRVLASERVPLSVVNVLCALGAKAKAEPIATFSERAGEFGAREGIGTVFRPFFRILSVANAVSIAPMMWNHIHDPGKMKVDVRGKSGEIHVTGYPGDPAGCARCAGWFRTILELSGGRNPVVSHGACTMRGGDTETWSFRWE